MAPNPATDIMRLRLQQAALELFTKHGFDRTTAAGIAARAGVTERTFFRYFPDKRETLFGGEAVLRPALTDALAAAPAGLSPLDALFHAFCAVLPLLEGNRDFAVPAAGGDCRNTRAARARTRQARGARRRSDRKLVRTRRRRGGGDARVARSDDGVHACDSCVVHYARTGTCCASRSSTHRLTGGLVLIT